MFEGDREQQKKTYQQGKLSPFYLAQTYAQMGDTANPQVSRSLL
jgi:hypothetical protein